MYNTTKINYSTPRSKKLRSKLTTSLATGLTALLLGTPGCATTQPVQAPTVQTRTDALMENRNMTAQDSKVTESAMPNLNRKIFELVTSYAPDKGVEYTVEQDGNEIWIRISKNPPSSMRYLQPVLASGKLIPCDGTRVCFDTKDGSYHPLNSSYGSAYNGRTDITRSDIRQLPNGKHWIEVYGTGFWGIEKGSWLREK